MDKKQIINELTELIDDIPIELHLNSVKTTKLAEFLKTILAYLVESEERGKTSAEIKQAMVNFTPVIHRGIEYKKINAYIYRIYVNPNTGKYKETYQLELQDKNTNSVTIADPKEVKLLNDREGGEK